MGKRRTFAPQFKAQVVLEVLTGSKRGAQICREHNITESALSRWKQEFLERAPELFERSPATHKQMERIAELERLVGCLTMELEMTKKAITQN
jgi:putative transposase